MFFFIIIIIIQVLFALKKNYKMYSIYCLLIFCLKECKKVKESKRHIFILLADDIQHLLFFIFTGNSD